MEVAVDEDAGLGAGVVGGVQEGGDVGVGGVEAAAFQVGEGFAGHAGTGDGVGAQHRVVGEARGRGQGVQDGEESAEGFGGAYTGLRAEVRQGELAAGQERAADERPGRVAVVLADETWRGDGQGQLPGKSRKDGHLLAQQVERDFAVRKAERPHPVDKEHSVVPSRVQELDAARLDLGKPAPQQPPHLLDPDLALRRPHRHHRPLSSPRL
ncbi:hypothetical protein R9X44_06120 [Actinocorallia sp. A-T 12471]|nr:hypothetical protein [Actinocorallia sp. A-T 12471]MDX6739326.1 hypothetical protein [Actinocorallia sp. A-T 12471]